MCDAGRIRHHLKHNLYNPLNSIVFVGYQAEGTLGRSLIEGAQEVTLFGEEIAVKAQIHNLEGFSGHADRDALYNWITGFTQQPHDIFLVHGEMDAKRDFAAYVKEHHGWDCIVVDGISEYELTEETKLTGGRKKQETEEKPAETAVEEFTSPTKIDDLKLRLMEMHETLDKVLSNTGDAVGSEASPEKLAEIKNLVASLEKDGLNLGSTITKEDRPADEELPLEGELPPKEIPDKEEKNKKK